MRLRETLGISADTEYFSKLSPEKGLCEENMQNTSIQARAAAAGEGPTGTMMPREDPKEMLKGNCCRAHLHRQGKGVMRNTNRTGKDRARDWAPRGFVLTAACASTSRGAPAKGPAPAAHGPELLLFSPPAKSGGNVIRAISTSKNIKTWKLWAVS